MAVNLTEAFTFAPAVTVPQPGDLRKAASVVLFAQQLADRTRYLYTTSRGGFFDVNRYGADPTALVDARAAIQNAIDDAAAANGGDVVLPGRYYLNGALVVPPRVNLIGVPGLTLLQQRNTTARTLSFTSGTANAQPNVIYGIGFWTPTGASSGSVIYNDAATVARICVLNCSFNEQSTSLGICVELNGARSQATIAKCQFINRGTALIDNLGVGADVTVLGCEFVWDSAVTSGVCVRNNNAAARTIVNANVFDGRDLGAGAGGADVVAASGYLAATGNVHRNAVATAHYAYSFGSSSIVTERGNSVDATAGLRKYDPGSVAAYGSSIDPGLSRAATTAGGAVSLPHGLDHYELVSPNTTPPTLVVPDMYARGQRMRLQIKNGSASLWSTAPAFSGSNFGSFLASGAPANVAAGGIVTYEITVSDITGSTKWNVTTVN